MFLFIGNKGTNLDLSRADYPYFGGPICFVTAARDVFPQTNDLVYFGGPVNVYSRG